ncbi:hypothetical protein [Hydrogenimonas urashimensis]|uniref:hypothetical protein n=1 Tax=Hydrogenimonas urashimensis TaxID=2740515 RepID=UPI001914FF63|nr:hypothetical protein [Hydrogenimonas urashimensis]
MAELYGSDADLGDFLGISPQTVKRYRDDGILPPKKRGSGTPIKKSIQQYIDHLKTGDEKPLEREKIRLTAAQADERELIVKELRGELIRTPLVIETWQAYTANARGKLLTIPTKAAGKLVSETETSVIEEILTDHIHEALKELANDGLPESYRKRLAESHGGDGPAAETESK